LRQRNNLRVDIHRGRAAAGIDSDEATGFTVDAFFEKAIAASDRDAGAILDAIGDAITPALQKEIPIVKGESASVLQGCYWSRQIFSGVVRSADHQERHGGICKALLAH
jgi:hypothetical protein